MQKACCVALRIINTVIILMILLSGCTKLNKNEIEVICVRNGYMQNYYEDKIDIKNKQYLRAGPLKGSETVEHYTFICDLEDDRIADFLSAVKDYGFLSWKEEYLPKGIIHDGHQWGIVIVFSDGTEKGIYGDNRYPDTWDEMSIAYEDLTGHIIFGVGRSRE